MRLNDPLFALFASIYGHADGGERVVVISAFVDEAGTGDEPNIVLGALVGDLNAWLSFNARWQSYLNKYEIDCAHYLDLRKGRRGYEDWSIDKKSRYTREGMRIIKDCCLFGFTITLDKQLYQDRYRADFPKGCSPDSAYALCAREVFGEASTLAERFFGNDRPTNYIFESGHRNAPNAAQVFADLKEHSPERDRYGTFSLGDKKTIKPLQAADHIAANARRNEYAAKKKEFMAVRGEEYESQFTSVQGDGCPIFYCPIEESALQFHRQQQQVLKGIRGRARNAAKAERRSKANEG